MALYELIVPDNLSDYVIGSNLMLSRSNTAVIYVRIEQRYTASVQKRKK
jgi:hypothetical protein